MLEKPFVFPSCQVLSHNVTESITKYCLKQTSYIAVITNLRLQEVCKVALTNESQMKSKDFASMHFLKMPFQLVLFNPAPNKLLIILHRIPRDHPSYLKTMSRMNKLLSKIIL